MSDAPAPRPGAPLGFALAAGALFFWAAAYLFFFSAGFRGDAFNEETGLFGPPEETPVLSASGKPDPLARGRRLFVRNCAICHQTEGQGLSPQYPPLAGSEIVLGREGYASADLVRIVLNGLVEPVSVRGVIYNGSMVPWRDALDDGEIADLLTYVRQAWGNQAAPVAAAEVAALRAATAGRHGPWTVPQLHAPAH